MASVTWSTQRWISNELMDETLPARWPARSLPPGLWAPADSLETTNEHARVALNIQTAIHGIEPMDLRDLATHSRRYDTAQETDLLPWLLGISLLLAMVDLLHFLRLPRHSARTCTHVANSLDRARRRRGACDGTIRAGPGETIRQSSPR
ncbi:MAG: hypothetical protein R3D03_15680 [Geminicoccaceae bacterium]